jgi:1,4-alpha-glucan branching enzyme
VAAKSKVKCKASKCKTKAKKATRTAVKLKKTIQSTEFALHAPDSKEVFLAGDFNDWSTTKHRLRKFKNDRCVKKLKLKPGKYEYQFIVDGDWWTDPANPSRNVNEFGTENSVLVVGEDVVVYK